MRYDEDRDVIVCQGCRREVDPPASALSDPEKGRLIACAIRYQIRNGLNLHARRDHGITIRWHEYPEFDGGLPPARDPGGLGGGVPGV